MAPVNASVSHTGKAKCAMKVLLPLCNRLYQEKRFNLIIDLTHACLMIKTDFPKTVDCH